MTLNPPAEFCIERAKERDVPLMLTLIKGLTEYERLSHEVVAVQQLKPQTNI